MNPSNHSPRRRRTIGLGAEALESRQLLTGSAGSTFAVLPGTIATAGGTTSVTFTIDPKHIKTSQGKITLGIDVVSAQGSTIRPSIASVSDSSGRPIRQVVHARYDPSIPRTKLSNGPTTSAVLAPLTIPAARAGQPVNFTVQVKGTAKTSGQFLLGFYLPGDTNGDGKVDPTDMKNVKSEMHLHAKSAKYTFDADANRDGMINQADMKVVKQNQGVSLDITPVVTAVLDPATDSGLKDRITNLRTVHFAGTATPGATVTYSELDNHAPTEKTTADSMGNYDVYIPLGDGANTFHITTMDAFGQSIQGNIAPVTFDVNAPQTSGSGTVKTTA